METVFMHRLKEAMAMRDKTQADICRETGLPSSAISSYYNGRYEPKPDKIDLIAKSLKVSASWLMGLSDNPSRAPSPSHAAIDAGVASRSPVRIPVVSEIAAGIPIEAIEGTIDDDDPDTLEEVPGEWLHGDRQFFALKVSGNSMSPDIPDGSIAIIEKCYEWHDNKVMAVYVNGYNATLKRVRIKNGGIIVLEAFNPEYETKIYTADEVAGIPVKPCGLLIETRKRW